jgi:hypothetical protein
MPVRVVFAHVFVFERGLGWGLAGHIESFHKTCAPQEEIDQFFTSDEMRCFLIEINEQVDTSVYFDEQRKYYSRPKNIQKARRLRMQRYNYLSSALKKVELFHTIQTCVNLLMFHPFPQKRRGLDQVARPRARASCSPVNTNGRIPDISLDFLDRSGTNFRPSYP